MILTHARYILTDNWVRDSTEESWHLPVPQSVSHRHPPPTGVSGSGLVYAGLGDFIGATGQLDTTMDGDGKISVGGSGMKGGPGFTEGAGLIVGGSVNWVPRKWNLDELFRLATNTYEVANDWLKNAFRSIPAFESTGGT